MFCFPCWLPQTPFPPEAAHSFREPGEASQHLDHMEEIGVRVCRGGLSSTRWGRRASTSTRPGLPPH